MLYSAELWPLTIPQEKKLDVAHHKFQRRLLGITWKDKVRNEDIGNQTKLQRMDLVIKKRRLRRLGHLLRMEDDRIPKQATRWQMDSCTRRPERPRSNWIDTVSRDLKSIGMAYMKTQSKQQSTEKTGVDLWPNVSLTRTELRSKVDSNWMSTAYVLSVKIGNSYIMEKLLIILVFELVLFDFIIIIINNEIFNVA